MRKRDLNDFAREVRYVRRWRLTSTLMVIVARTFIRFQFTISRFESSRPSQPVRRPKIQPSEIREMPANGGPLRFIGWSPDSEFGELPTQKSESLRLNV